MRYKKFKCSCGFGFIEIDIRPLGKREGLKIPYVGMTMYKSRSEHTGKKLKKPIELGTVVLIDEEAKKFIKHFKDLK